MQTTPQATLPQWRNHWRRRRLSSDSYSGWKNGNPKTERELFGE
jgi:hypothetical protein